MIICLIRWCLEKFFLVRFFRLIIIFEQYVVNINFQGFNIVLSGILSLFQCGLDRRWLTVKGSTPGS